MEFLLFGWLSRRTVSAKEAGEAGGGATGARIGNELYTSKYLSVTLH